jgi:hypothetical protein
MKGLITNDWDRDNLNFLLKASPAVIQDWDEQADEDDRIYAQELLNAYAEELRVESCFLATEAKLGMLVDYPDARRVIDSLGK